MSGKKLNSRKKRNALINKIFKKDKTTGFVIGNSRIEIFYEGTNQEVRNLKYYHFWEIKQKNKNCTKIFIREIFVGPPKKDKPYPEGALLSRNDNLFGSRRGATGHGVIYYEKNLDQFRIRINRHENQYDLDGIINNSKKILFSSTENEDQRSLGNAWVGFLNWKKSNSSNKLPEDILQKIEGKNFDTIFNTLYKSNNTLIE